LCSVYNLKPTGDPEKDREMAQMYASRLVDANKYVERLTNHRLQEEKKRLEKNQERRFVRERQKGRLNKRQASPTQDRAVSPSSTPIPTVEKATGTTRKCANCGQAGHIKTNKKYCPAFKKKN
jgi:hypothetical protein